MEVVAGDVTPPERRISEGLSGALSAERRWNKRNRETRAEHENAKL